MSPVPAICILVRTESAAVAREAVRAALGATLRGARVTLVIPAEARAQVGDFARSCAHLELCGGAVVEGLSGVPVGRVEVWTGADSGSGSGSDSDSGSDSGSGSGARLHLVRAAPPPEALVGPEDRVLRREPHGFADRLGQPLDSRAVLALLFAHDDAIVW
jgi:hypothetical protein